MIANLKLVALTIICVAALTVQEDDRNAASESVGQFVCPPCGLDCDKKVFDKPGKCPGCGMTLIDKAKTNNYNVANRT